jgi:hypothetical protein
MPDSSRRIELALSCHLGGGAGEGERDGVVDVLVDQHQQRY